MKVTRKAGKIDQMRQAVKGLDSAVSRTGWFASAKYEKGQPVAGIAAVQEFGSDKRGIPPRLGMRQVAEEKRPEWAAAAAHVARQVARGNLAPSAVAEAVAMAAAGHVRAHITKVVSPPLAPATVAARRRRLADGGASAQATIAKPLVDTGILLNTLTYEVEP